MFKDDTLYHFILNKLLIEKYIEIFFANKFK